VILIKTQKEIDQIRISGKLTARVLEHVRQYVREGITTKELDTIAEDFIRSNDAKPAFKGYPSNDAYSFPGTLCISIDEEVVHGIPGERVLKAGEIVSIDTGVIKNGFYGDSAITVAVGEISPEKKRLMEATEKSLYLAIEQAVVGNRIGDIGYAVQSYVEPLGYSVVRELCGHGVGKHLHEEPNVPNFGVRNRGNKLKNGMTIAIEPMINLGRHEVKVLKDGWTVVTADKKPSAHFEHTIAIIDNKPEILTIG